tara:strand:+ start:665 stop:874 length:210 start_codon:yes stop_codon:yes gene_type:complete
MTDVSNIDFSLVKETSQDTLRLSVDGTKTVLKFKGETPDFLVGLQQFSHLEILEVMDTPAWTNNNGDLI